MPITDFRQQKAAVIVAFSELAKQHGFQALTISADDGCDLSLRRVIDGALIRVCLKNRWHIDQRFVGAGVWMAFPIDDEWYLAPHDEMVRQGREGGRRDFTQTDAWKREGCYHLPSAARHIRAACEPFRLGRLPDGVDVADSRPQAKYAARAAREAKPATVRGEGAIGALAAIHHPKPGHRQFAEGQRNVSFQDLFWPWLEGAARIVLTDPYIRLFHQVRNLMELVEMIAIHKNPMATMALILVTCPNELNPEGQKAYLEKVRQAGARAGIDFTWSFEPVGAIHARHMVTDTGWKITLDRGLDIFQRFEANDALSLEARMQAHRSVKAFEVTYLRLG